MIEDDGIAAPTITFPERDERRPRGYLEHDVLRVCNAFRSGELALDEPLTPHRIGKELMRMEGLTKKPSTGAISDVLKRWVKLGFAHCDGGPFAFVDLTDAGKELGLAELKARAALPTAA